MPNQKVNTYENLMHKLAQNKINYMQAKTELDIVKKKNEILSADNTAYQDNLFELKIKVHLFQKQEAEKTKQMAEELADLRKIHQEALLELERLKAKLPKE